MKTFLRSALLLSLVAFPLALLAQQGTSGMGQQGSSMSGQTVTATGCLQKGQEHGGYYLKDENGKDWELMGSNLASHVGQKVTVTGSDMQASKSHERKVEADEKAEAGGDQHGDLHVTQVTMVSSNCQ